MLQESGTTSSCPFKLQIVSSHCCIPSANLPRWRPGRITASVLQAASIFPTPDRVAAFERSAAYLDMIYQDLA